MGNKFMYDEDLFENELDNDKVDGQTFHLKEEDYSYMEDDYYRPLDNRVWTSNVEDIDGGDNFADYCGYIFGILDEEGYYDN